MPRFWPLLLLATCLTPLRADDTPVALITSHLGNEGPAFAPGMTPSVLGWGPDDVPYPDRLVINPPDGAEMAWVPAGDFDMGSTSQEQTYALVWARMLNAATASASLFADESPVHRVRITRGFWLYRHEVTNAQYRRLDPAHDSGEAFGAALNDDLQPAVNVSWDDAQGYCLWAGARLPTEAEWEYACRAGTSSVFWWGDSEEEAGLYANVADRAAKARWPRWRILDTDDRFAATAPVGSYLPNAFGLFDMLGNVWEWCQDWHQAGYYWGSPAEDPTGPTTGTMRSLRGGCWTNQPSPARCADRMRNKPDVRIHGNGFRPARTP